MNTFNKNYQKMQDGNIFKSLNQGLELLSERKNNILFLKKNINHSRDNIIEGFIEGNTNRDDCSTGTDISANIACYKKKHETSVMEYQTTLEDYSGNYKTFLQNIKDVQTDVSDCKLKCYNESTGYHIVSTDYGDGDPNVPNVAKKKGDAIKACKIGCHLNLPQIMSCTSEFGKTVSAGPTNIVAGMSCAAIYAKNNYKQKVNSSDGFNERSQLISILDASGNNAYNHCCEGKLKEKYKPYKIMNGEIRTACTDFPSATPTTNPGLKLQTACEKGKSLFSTSLPNHDFIKQYETLITQNESMMTTSNDILDLVKELKKLNVEIVKSKGEESMKFRSDNQTYESVLDNIKNESNPLKINTLNKFIEDKILLKKSTDLKLYVWIVLALGFGISALMKIKSL